MSAEKKYVVIDVEHPLSKSSKARREQVERKTARKKAAKEAKKPPSKAKLKRAKKKAAKQPVVGYDAVLDYHRLPGSFETGKRR